MSLRAVVYGPGMTAAGRVSKGAQSALDDINLRGYGLAVTPRDAEEEATDFSRRLYKGLTTAFVLILLPGWEDLKECVVLGQMATSLGLETYSYSGPGVELKLLSPADILAPIMPGYGVIAPDADENELPHEEAARIVLGPRGAYYDSPLANFERIGLIWSGILHNKLQEGKQVSAEDVSLCMLGVKMSRESFRHKRDNLVDAHGYLLTYQMVLDERARRENEDKNK